MSKLVPVNDNFLVEVGDTIDNPQGFVGGNDVEEGVRKGRIVAISDFLAYWGSHTYYFDSSAMNEEMLQKVHDKYKEWVGKIVYWPERSESGTAVTVDGKKYVFMKFASIMGVEEE